MRRTRKAVFFSFFPASLASRASFASSSFLYLHVHLLLTPFSDRPRDGAFVDVSHWDQENGRALLAKDAPYWVA